MGLSYGHMLEKTHSRLRAGESIPQPTCFIFEYRIDDRRFAIMTLSHCSRICYVRAGTITPLRLVSL